LLRPIRRLDGWHTFCLPGGTTSARLVSRAGAPCMIRPWSSDDRVLGVAVTDILLRDDAGCDPIPLDHPALADGWWSVERDAAAPWRWTNGDAALPLPARPRACLLDIRILPASHYRADAVVPVAPLAA
jgi:hypothetical protein